MIKHWRTGSGQQHLRSRYRAVLTLLLLLSGSVQAEPYVPATAATVLAELPRAEITSRPTLARLSAELQADPSRDDIRAQLVRAHIDLNQRTGDPRYLGFAETALDNHNGTVELQLASAHLLQARHDFSQAIDALRSILERNPDESRAWLMLASVAEVVGDYDRARNACARLIVLGDTLPAIACAASVASVTGRSADAYRQLESNLRRYDNADPELGSWAHVVAAEIAQRLGNWEHAERHLRAARSDPNNLYATVALADLLLHLDRAAEARSLLSDQPPSDAVLLRRAIAARHLGADDAPALAERIGQRLATLQWRGDSRHAREQALYALEINVDAAAALDAARLNWQQQHESIDARLLLEAAIKARQADAATPVLEWMDANRSDDRRLWHLRQQLERQL